MFGKDPYHAVKSGRVGAMLQSGGLMPEVTVRELVTLVAGLHPRPVPVDTTLRQGRHRGHRRPARGPAVRRADAARQVLARDRGRVRPDRARRADHGDGRGDQAAVLGADEGRGRRGQDAAVRDPLPGGGRPGRRPHPGDQPGTAARRRHAGRHQEEGRRQADVVPPRRGRRVGAAPPAGDRQPGDQARLRAAPDRRLRRDAVRAARRRLPAERGRDRQPRPRAGVPRHHGGRRPSRRDRVRRPHADFHEGDENNAAASCC